jgi:putative two-component system response regulator
LVPRIRNALVVKAHHDHLAEYSSQLEQEVQQRTKELRQSREEVIRVLACAAEYRDQETGNHVLRVGRYAGIVARQLGFTTARVEMIEQAAILHDVGKIGIPDSILLKPGKLTDVEFATMRNHCEYGGRILEGTPSHACIAQQPIAETRMRCKSPILKVAASIAATHHEKWDGSGYPLGLSGEAIPIEGRITAVVDVFDALSSKRPYKEPFPIDRCFEILEEGRGRHFDPNVLDAFLAGADEIMHVALTLADG